MKPAPANIAIFGEGPDPEPFAHAKREVALAARAEYYDRLPSYALVAAIAVAVGGASTLLHVLAPLVLIAACVVSTFYARGSAAKARADLATARASMLMPVKIIDPPPEEQ